MSQNHFINIQLPFLADLQVFIQINMTDSDRHIKMEIDYSSVVDQKLKECDELMKVNYDTKIIHFLNFQIWFRIQLNSMKF